MQEQLSHLAGRCRVATRSTRTEISAGANWDETVSHPETWLGGNGNDSYSARGFDTLRRMFAGEFGAFDPPLSISAHGNVAWKIRKTENLWEHITSQY